MSVLTPEEVLALVPQQTPMRFIEEILEIDEDHILGAYTWKAADCAGYAADDKTVPPFKMIEMAAQVGSVAWCIYHMTLKMAPEEIKQLVGFFTQIEKGEFKAVVRAGDKVACMATFDNEGYFRGNKLVSHVEMQFDGGPRDGEEIFSGEIAGMWVPRTS